MSSRLTDALDAVGARLKRAKKHRVYELPNGRTFVVSSTPSDVRAEANALTGLKAVSGVDVRPERRKASAEVRAERRQRPGRNGEPSRLGLPAEESPMAAALRSTGLIEQQLRVRIGQLESELAGRTAQVERLESLWVVRTWRRLGGAI